MSEKIQGIFMIAFFILIGLSFSPISLDDKAMPQSSKNLFYQDYLELTAKYPHNQQSFTEGLFFYQGKLYESTGLYGESFLYKNMDIKTGEAESYYRFPDSIFLEGTTVFKDQLYALTYQENKAYVLNPNTLEIIKTIFYPREGWGLTTNGEELIASDGSSTIYFMDEDLEVNHSILVTYDGKEIKNINELEYIDGYLWANVWKTNDILIINPKTGEVIQKIDFTTLYQQGEDIENVLNGIAYNPDTGKIYITGKRWHTLFEFERKDN